MGDTNKELIQSVLNSIKNDDVKALDEEIKNGIPKNIQLPPELDSEPEIMRNGATFICAAAFYGSINCMKYLISNGWDPTMTDDEGCSVAFYAAASGHFNVIKTLIELKIDVTGCGQASLRHNQFETFKQLVESKIIGINDKDPLGSTYLHIAAFTGNVEAVKFLLSFKDIDPNAKDFDEVFIFDLIEPLYIWLLEMEIMIFVSFFLNSKEFKHKFKISMEKLLCIMPLFRKNMKLLNYSLEAM